MSTNRKFEAHITLPREQGERAQTSALPGWSYSAIDGDPVMGKQAFAYLTAYDPNGSVLLCKVRQQSEHLKQAGITVLREKVEEIVYDTKTNHNVLY